MGELKPCCADLENRGEPQQTEKPELTFTVCLVCDSRHFVLDFDAVELVSEGAAL